MEEKILLETKPSWIILLPHLILMLFGIGFITIWKPLFAFISTQLTITEKRVSAKTGLIKTDSMDSPLNKVTSVKVNQGMFGKILNYGSLYINTPAGNYTFNYIPDANSVKEIIISNIK